MTDREALAKLRAFAQEILRCEVGGVNAGYLSDADIQEIAKGHGLLSLEETIAPCGDFCQCVDGDEDGRLVWCYRETDLLAGSSG